LERWIVCSTGALKDDWEIFLGYAGGERDNPRFPRKCGIAVTQTGVRCSRRRCNNPAGDVSFREMERASREMERAFHEMERALRDIERGLREMQPSLREMDRGLREMERTLRDMEPAFREKTNGDREMRKPDHPLWSEPSEPPTRGSAPQHAPGAESMRSGSPLAEGEGGHGAIRLVQPVLIGWQPSAMVHTLRGWRKPTLNSQHAAWRALRLTNSTPRQSSPTAVQWRTFAPR